MEIHTGAMGPQRRVVLVRKMFELFLKDSGKPIKRS